MIRSGKRMTIDGRPVRIYRGEESPEIGECIVLDPYQLELHKDMLQALSDEKMRLIEDIFKTPCEVYEVNHRSLNSLSDCCSNCGYQPVCKIFVNKVHKLVPFCGSEDREDELNVYFPIVKK